MWYVFQVIAYLDSNRFKYKNQEKLKGIYTDNSMAEMVNGSNSKSGNFSDELKANSKNI